MLTILIMSLLATVLCALLVSSSACPTGPSPKPVRPPWINKRIQRIMLALREMIHFGQKGECFANIGETVTPFGTMSKLADSGAAGIARYSICKHGTDVNHVTINAASTTIPLGVLIDEANSAEDAIAVQLFGTGRGTMKVIASAAIALDGLCYTTTVGKVQPTPAGSSGVAYKVGRALQAASADGDIIEIEPCFPLSVTF